MRVASAIREEKGNLGIIFSNAGYYQGRKIEEVSEEFLDSMPNVNLKGQLFTLQAMLPIMNQGGSIILTSSMTAFIGLPEYTAYAATKAAVFGMVAGLERGRPLHNPVIPRVALSQRCTCRAIPMNNLWRFCALATHEILTSLCLLLGRLQSFVKLNVRRTLLYLQVRLLSSAPKRTAPARPATTS